MYIYVFIYIYILCIYIYIHTNVLYIYIIMYIMVYCTSSLLLEVPRFLASVRRPQLGISTATSKSSNWRRTADGDPPGKQPQNYGKSPFLFGKLTISIVIVNSYILVIVITRGYPLGFQTWLEDLLGSMSFANEILISLNNVEYFQRCEVVQRPFSMT